MWTLDCWKQSSFVWNVFLGFPIIFPISNYYIPHKKNLACLILCPSKIIVRNQEVFQTNLTSSIHASPEFFHLKPKRSDLPITILSFSAAYLSKLQNYKKKYMCEKGRKESVKASNSLIFGNTCWTTADNNCWCSPKPVVLSPRKSARTKMPNITFCCQSL